MQRIFNGPFHKEMTLYLWHFCFSKNGLRIHLDIIKTLLDFFLFTLFSLFYNSFYFSCCQLPTYLDKHTTNTFMELQIDFVDLGIREKLNHIGEKIKSCEKGFFWHGSILAYTALNLKSSNEQWSENDNYHIIDSQ